MADTRLRISDVPAALFDETRLLHIGSISLLRGSTPDAIEATARRLAGRALISVDPNIRPGLVRDRAAYGALLERLFGLANVIKISAADLAWLMPDAPVATAAERLQAHGTQLVVVTRGGAGALALHASGVHEAPVFPVDVVDAVGAGDAFSSGLLAELALVTASLRARGKETRLRIARAGVFFLTRNRRAYARATASLNARLAIALASATR